MLARRGELSGSPTRAHRRQFNVLKLLLGQPGTLLTLGGDDSEAGDVDVCGARLLHTKGVSQRIANEIVQHVGPFPACRLRCPKGRTPEGLA